MRFYVFLTFIFLMFATQLPAAVAGPSTGSIATTTSTSDIAVTATLDQQQRPTFREKVVAFALRKQAKKAVRRAKRGKDGERGNGLVNTGLWLGIGSLAVLLVGGWIVTPFLALASGVIGLISRKRYAKGTKYRKRANISIIIGTVGIISGLILIIVSTSLSSWASGFGG